MSELVEDLTALLTGQAHPSLPELTRDQAAVLASYVGGCIRGLGWQPPREGEKEES